MAKSQDKKTINNVTLYTLDRPEEIATEYPWVLRGLGRKWARLKLWGRDISQCEIKISQCDNLASTGHAWPNKNKLEVIAGRDKADGLATLVHELAHLAAGQKHDHDRKWRMIFREAVEHICGWEEVTVKGITHNSIHESAVRAFVYTINRNKIICSPRVAPQYIMRLKQVS